MHSKDYIESINLIPFFFVLWFYLFLFLFLLYILIYQSIVLIVYGLSPFGLTLPPITYSCWRIYCKILPFHFIHMLFLFF